MVVIGLNGSKMTDYFLFAELSSFYFFTSLI
jgi:hypothetical protein